ncbi:hypothetical protein [Chondromyces apiculatus]|uniref:Uncharacterized protein n=1 Tax=Chondromyces apiculatus DSM 436 TaxID=1192034 RepID=A0A017SZC3_9BACT|nr:hypothetical protein [Chondromyces apiculatus]EYF01641.1 Hypothetical protein CAP_7960 [Chondromyces apiculatus DSM 436]
MGTTDPKTAAAADAKKEAVGCTTQGCPAEEIVAYDIEGHYIGTKPPAEDEVWLSTKAVVDANRSGEYVNRKPILDSEETKSIPKEPPKPITGKHSDLLLLAAISYGEASTANVYEEMAGIANVLVRQAKARSGGSISGLVSGHRNFAYAASDGNARFAAFKAKQLTLVDMREGNDGMRLAIKGAINALRDGHDYSNGAYFWDGKDLGTNYSNHEKVKKGLKFSDESHRIFTVDGSPIADNAVPTTTYWYDKNGKATKERGSYDYTYETTAVWGSTVFSKTTDAYRKATGGKPHM